MKTEREIWEKIEKIEISMGELKRMCRGCTKEFTNNKLEPYRCMIDALLWVVGDESGNPI